MPEQNEPPRPHGDPLEEEIVEPNQAQRQSDASRDAGQMRGREEPTGTGTSANGTPASDQDDDGKRREQYDGGAELVSKID